MQVLTMKSTGLNFARLFMAGILALGFSLPSHSSGTDAPAQVVDKLHSELLYIMKEAKTLGYEGRFKRLDPIIMETFDLPFIAKIAVGRYWRTFDDNQKRRFVEIFSNLSVATYANRFDGFSGERFTVTSKESLPRGRIMVRTQLIKPDGERIDLDYILNKNKGAWRIINVIAEGVSDLSLKRADYTAYIKGNGYDAFMDKLNEKIATYSE